MIRNTWFLALLVACIPVQGGAQSVATSPNYLLFESGPVRPVALSPNGKLLFVANTPDNQLEIFQVSPSGLLSPHGSVQVGMEPVSVLALSDDEVWVVNHLSDSVSIVDTSGGPRVVRTLLVGDEPRDIVFAGSPDGRVFISTAHRGQHRQDASIAGVPGAGDPELTTPGVPRADVWVFDPANLGSTLGGTPLEILSFFADTPRALATDGSTVYVAAFHSGNQSTAITETVVCDGFDGAGPCGAAPGGVPGPAFNVDGDPAPESGLIVRYDGSAWRDAVGRDWSALVNLNLPDHDVFAIDGNTLSMDSVEEFDHVGTILFNMVVNPHSGKVYVTNTESPNHVRFEGPGEHGGSTVQGRLSESRITVLDPATASVDPQHLNQHIDYTKLHTDVPDLVDPTQKDHSLATPLQVVVSSDPADQKVYVAAFGSAKVGVFDAAEIEDPNFESNFDPTAESGEYIETGGGPAGLALNASNDRLYVFTRFDNSVSVVAVGGTQPATLQTVKLHSPEPESVVAGRRMLYDAMEASGNGEASCASCHIFGDLDSLAWNLGNPDDLSTSNPQPIFGLSLPGAPGGPDFHPMKGPMTTQSLRGMATHGGLHWRGDRTNGFFGIDPCSSPVGAACDEELSFMNFIVAFEGLLGRDGIPSVTDMEDFTDFALQLMYPPNPVTPLDGVLTPSQASGSNLYFNAPADGGFTCNACHRLDGVQGLFGTTGQQSIEGEPQLFKISHLRNMYAKVGMFGISSTGPNMLDQIRGFGFLHDGSVDTVFNFLDIGPFALSQQEILDLEQFMLAFPSDLAPVVGQQITLGPENFANPEGNGRVSLLEARSSTPFQSLLLGGSVTECELVVSTLEGGVQRGYLRGPGGDYLPSDGGPAITPSALRAKANPAGSAQSLTYSCVPPGSGTRIGTDRDVDSLLDELDNCPAAPNGPALGTCTSGDPLLLASSCTSAAACGSGGFCSLAQEDGDLDGVGDACEITLLPEPGPSLLLCVGSVALSLLHARTRSRGRRSMTA